MDDAQLIDSPRERPALTFVQFADHSSGPVLLADTSVFTEVTRPSTFEGGRRPQEAPRRRSSEAARGRHQGLRREAGEARLSFGRQVEAKPPQEVRRACSTCPEGQGKGLNWQPSGSIPVSATNSSYRLLNKNGRSDSRKQLLEAVSRGCEEVQCRRLDLQLCLADQKVPQVQVDGASGSYPAPVIRSKVASGWPTTREQEHRETPFYSTGLRLANDPRQLAGISAVSGTSLPGRSAERRN
jgi:hypothetical protein